MIQHRSEKGKRLLNYNEFKNAFGVITRETNNTPIKNYENNDVYIIMEKWI